MADGEDSVVEVYSAIAMLSLFSIVGVIGNALVIYVFSNFKQKLTSTIFILSLAGTDFFTCLVTIPFTIAVESLHYRIYNIFLCQFYQFLITTTVPFSAFVMVAIAVDRYLCICHPFNHTMTIRRAKYIVSFLCAFACLLGVLCCLNYTIDAAPDGMTKENITLANNSTNNSMPFNETYVTINKTIFEHGYCSPKNIESPFFYVYQKIYSSFFAICCAIVMVLYAIIYRSVLARRRQRFQIATNKCCGFWADIPNEVEHTEITTLNAEISTVDVKDTDKAEQKNGNAANNEKDTIIRPGSVSKFRLEKMKMANIKTAFMLSIVTLVFIVAFVPSWLVALRVLDMNVVVFYMYFLYNVANPVIYAFLNIQFRTKLWEMFHCRS